MIGDVEVTKQSRFICASPVSYEGW